LPVGAVKPGFAAGLSRGVLPLPEPDDGFATVSPPTGATSAAVAVCVAGGAHAPAFPSVRRRCSPVRSSRATRRGEIRNRFATPPRDRGGPAPMPARRVRTRR
jgi:hypothetical protein